MQLKTILDLELFLRNRIGISGDLGNYSYNYINNMVKLYESYKSEGE